MSKKGIALAGVVMLTATILGARGVPQGPDPAVLLRAAIEKEEVDGNLEAAIEQYRQIIKIAGTNRAVAAQALLRLGGCYEKRGPEEARRAYQQLIRDYAEQAKEVAAARQRLAALTAGAPATAHPGDSRLAIRRLPDYKTIGSLDMLAKPSPDGKYFAVTDWKSGNLTIVDVATGATRPLTTDGAMGQVSRYPMFCAWSRDSRRVACDWSLQGPNEDRVEARIVSVEGNAPPQKISLPGSRWIEPLDWSADGSRVLCLYGPADGGTAVALVTVGGDAVDTVDVPAEGWLPHFTQDGSALLYSAAADGKAGRRDVYLRDLKTGAVTTVVQHPAEDLVLGVLPGTDWLFFASDRRASLDLWAVQFRDQQAVGQPVLVKQGLGRVYPLGFTNDGRYYYATLSASDDLFFADFDRESGKVTGEARKLISRWDGVSTDASFSPDGASLAYVVKRGPRPIPMHSADSLVVQSLKDPKADPAVVGFDDLGLIRVAGPCWADAQTIMVGGYGSYSQGPALYRVELPGLRRTRIFSPPEGWRMTRHDCATGSPGVNVALEALPVGRESGRVIRLDADGGRARDVFRAPEGQRLSGPASMSPDGRTLSVVTIEDRYRRALFVMPADGGAPRRIHEFRQPTGGGVDSVWSPDGRSILYVQRSEEWNREEERAYLLRSVRADGSSAAAETVFLWRGQFFGVRFHPSGRQLVFTGRPAFSTSSEVWVIENLREELRLLAPSAPGRLR